MISPAVPARISRARRFVRRVVRVTPAEWREVVSAQLALLAAQLSVWTRPTGTLVMDQSPSDAYTPTPAAYLQARRVATAVQRAAEHGVFRPQCLVRSIALNRMLARRGIAGSCVCVGVRRDGDRFAAHAWVELDGRVLGDLASHVGSFTPLTDVHVV